MPFNDLKPSFALVDHDGHSVSEIDYRGRYVIIFFGFTNCGVVCPRALERLTDALKELGHDDASRIIPLYISVDPDRDTPEAMKSFLSDRAPAFIGLTGTTDQVDAAKRSFHVFSQQKIDSNGGYTVPHTAFTYILGPDGQLLDHFHDALDVHQVAKPTDEPSVSKESLAKLDAKQVASIRHIGNLARQLKGDWSNMMGPTHLNDGFGAYRFQLSYAAYALALAHFHRLPAASGLFKGTFDRIITKMCEPDVWYYWRDNSTGGGPFQTPRSEPNANPVEKDNIMYSAYLQTLVLLYNSLFNDNRYTVPGSLRLQYDPFFWGDIGGFDFEYDQNSLNDRIYWNMVESGFLGVACEPYCVFQICNMPAIIGFRLNDELTGGNTAEEVTTGYLKAWDDFGGRLDDTGGYKLLVARHINAPIPSGGPGMDAWCATLMHSWSPDFVTENYKRQRKQWIIDHEDGTKSVKVERPPRLSENTANLSQSGFFGWVTACAAELGDTETLQGLLAYADKRLSPRIQNGGLTYPRNDTVHDKNGYYAMTSPIQANALLPLARLNVPSGFQKLYEKPWGPKNAQHYAEPALTEVDFCVDVYRAVYIPERHSLLFDLAVFEEGHGQGSVVISRVFERGPWVLGREGEKIAWGDSSELVGSDPTVDVQVVDGQLLRLGVADTRVTSFVLEWST
ncbi:SCO1/SenC-domain-containing protein [Aspergillus heterothallicus]